MAISRPQEFCSRIATIKVAASFNEATEFYFKMLKARESEDGKKLAQWFFKHLGKHKLDNLQTIMDVCNDEITYLKENLHKGSGNTKVSLGSVREAITRYRRVIKQNLGEDHVALAFLKLDKADQDLIESTQKRERSNRGIKNFYPKIERVKNGVKCGFIQHAMKMLKSNSYIEIGVGLMALTGRRAGEIFCTGNFSLPNEDVTEEYLESVPLGFSVIFSGQLKTKDSDKAKDNYEIPTLVPAKIIIDALKRLRDKKDFSYLLTEYGNINVANGEIITKMVNNVTGKSQNQVCQSFCQFTEVNRIEAKDLRKMYCSLTYHLFEPYGVGREKFNSEILGHSKDDLTTQIYYTDFRIIV
jgi:hypothetical protein